MYLLCDEDVPFLKELLRLREGKRWKDFALQLFSGVRPMKEAPLSSTRLWVAHQLNTLSPSSSTLEEDLRSVLAEALWLCVGGDPGDEDVMAPMRVPSGVCGTVWNQGSVAYKCRTCERDPTCAICLDCFVASDHEGHDWCLIRSGGGCCDCGDLDAWSLEGCCPNHRGPPSSHPLTFLGDRTCSNALAVVNVVIEWAMQVIMCSKAMKGRVKGVVSGMTAGGFVEGIDLPHTLTVSRAMRESPLSAVSVTTIVSIVMEWLHRVSGESSALKSLVVAAMVYPLETPVMLRSPSVFPVQRYLSHLRSRERPPHAVPFTAAQPVGRPSTSSSSLSLPVRPAKLAQSSPASQTSLSLLQILLQWDDYEDLSSGYNSNAGGGFLGLGNNSGGSNDSVAHRFPKILHDYLFCLLSDVDFKVALSNVFSDVYLQRSTRLRGALEAVLGGRIERELVFQFSVQIFTVPRLTLYLAQRFRLFTNMLGTFLRVTHGVSSRSTMRTTTRSRVPDPRFYVLPPTSLSLQLPNAIHTCLNEDLHALFAAGLPLANTPLLVRLLEIITEFRYCIKDSTVARYLLWNGGADMGFPYDALPDDETECPMKLSIDRVHDTGDIFNTNKYDGQEFRTHDDGFSLSLLGIAADDLLRARVSSIPMDPCNNSGYSHPALHTRGSGNITPPPPPRVASANSGNISFGSGFSHPFMRAGNNSAHSSTASTSHSTENIAREHTSGNISTSSQASIHSTSSDINTPGNKSTNSPGSVSGSPPGNSCTARGLPHGDLRFRNFGHLVLGGRGLDVYLCALGRVQGATSVVLSTVDYDDNFVVLDLNGLLQLEMELQRCSASLSKAIFDTAITPSLSSQPSHIHPHHTLIDVDLDYHAKVDPGHVIGRTIHAILSSLTLTARYTYRIERLSGLEERLLLYVLETGDRHTLQIPLQRFLAYTLLRHIESAGGDKPETWKLLHSWLHRACAGIGEVIIEGSSMRRHSSHQLDMLVEMVGEREKEKEKEKEKEGEKEEEKEGLEVPLEELEGRGSRSPLAPGIIPRKTFASATPSTTTATTTTATPTGASSDAIITGSSAGGQGGLSVELLSLMLCMQPLRIWAVRAGCWATIWKGNPGMVEQQFQVYSSGSMYEFRALDMTLIQLCVQQFLSSPLSRTVFYAFLRTLFDLKLLLVADNQLSFERYRKASLPRESGNNSGDDEERESSGNRARETEREREREREEETFRQQSVMLEEFLRFLLVLYSDRTSIGGSDRIIAREAIIHTICQGPIKHSQVQERISKRISKLTCFEEELRSTTVFKQQNDTGRVYHRQGALILKPGLWHLINPARFMALSERHATEQQFRQDQQHQHNARNNSAGGVSVSNSHNSHNSDNSAVEGSNSHNSHNSAGTLATRVGVMSTHKSGLKALAEALRDPESRAELIDCLEEQVSLLNDSEGNCFSPIESCWKKMYWSHFTYSLWFDVIISAFYGCPYVSDLALQETLLTIIIALRADSWEEVEEEDRDVNEDVHETSRTLRKLYSHLIQSPRIDSPNAWMFDHLQHTTLCEDLLYATAPGDALNTPVRVPSVKEGNKYGGSEDDDAEDSTMEDVIPSSKSEEATSLLQVIYCTYVVCCGDVSPVLSSFAKKRCNNSEAGKEGSLKNRDGTYFPELFRLSPSLESGERSNAKVDADVASEPRLGGRIIDLLALVLATVYERSPAMRQQLDHWISNDLSLLSALSSNNSLSAPPSALKTHSGGIAPPQTPDSEIIASESETDTSMISERSGASPNVQLNTPASEENDKEKARKLKLQRRKEKMLAKMRKQQQKFMDKMKEDDASATPSPAPQQSSDTISPPRVALGSDVYGRLIQPSTPESPKASSRVMQRQRSMELDQQTTCGELDASFRPSTLECVFCHENTCPYAEDGEGYSVLGLGALISRSDAMMTTREKWIEQLKSEGRYSETVHSIPADYDFDLSDHPHPVDAPDDSSIHRIVIPARSDSSTQFQSPKSLHRHDSVFAEMDDEEELFQQRDVLYSATYGENEGEPGVEDMLDSEDERNGSAGIHDAESEESEDSQDSGGRYHVEGLEGDVLEFGEDGDEVIDLEAPSVGSGDSLHPDEDALHPAGHSDDDGVMGAIVDEVMHGDIQSSDESVGIGTMGELRVRGDSQGSVLPPRSPLLHPSTHSSPPLYDPEEQTSAIVHCCGHVFHLGCLLHHVDGLRRSPERRATNSRREYAILQVELEDPIELLCPLCGRILNALIPLVSASRHKAGDNSRCDLLKLSTRCVRPDILHTDDMGECSTPFGPVNLGDMADSEQIREQMEMEDGIPYLPSSFMDHNGSTGGSKSSVDDEESALKAMSNHDAAIFRLAAKVCRLKTNRSEREEQTENSVLAVLNIAADNLCTLEFSDRQLLLHGDGTSLSTPDSLLLASTSHDPTDPSAVINFLRLTSYETAVHRRILRSIQWYCQSRPTESAKIVHLLRYALGTVPKDDAIISEPPVWVGTGDFFKLFLFHCLLDAGAVFESLATYLLVVRQYYTLQMARVRLGCCRGERERERGRGGDGERERDVLAVMEEHAHLFLRRVALVTYILVPDIVNVGELSKALLTLKSTRSRLSQQHLDSHPTAAAHHPYTTTLSPLLKFFQLPHPRTLPYNKLLQHRLGSKHNLLHGKGGEKVELLHHPMYTVWSLPVTRSNLLHVPTPFSVSLCAQQQFFKLPGAFHQLYTDVFQRERERLPKRPTVCLLCGEVVGLAARVGNCTQHLETCKYLYASRHKNLVSRLLYPRPSYQPPCAIFLVLDCTMLLVLRSKRHTMVGSIYLDEHGEEDRSLQRNVHLLLDVDRLAELRRMYIRNEWDFSEEIVKFTERASVQRLTL